MCARTLLQLLTAVYGPLQQKSMSLGMSAIRIRAVSLCPMPNVSFVAPDPLRS